MKDDKQGEEGRFEKQQRATVDGPYADNLSGSSLQACSHNADTAAPARRSTRPVPSVAIKGLNTTPCS